jgi:dipeptidyl aminopeptidase/acylaminoacyl peptidase
MGAMAELAREILQRWHDPALDTVTAITDPRPNPVSGLIAATGSSWPTPVGPPRARVVTIDAGAVTDVGPAHCGSKFPRWSPDGATLAFTTDRAQQGIHQLAYASADDLAVVSDGPVVPGTIEMLCWSPAGGSLLAVVAGYGAENAGAMASGRVPVIAGAERTGADPLVRSFPGVTHHDEWRRLWVLTPGGDARCVTPDGPNVWEAAWCGPDRVVAVISDRCEEDAWYSARCSILDVSTGSEVQVLCTSERQLGVPAGSPDGRWAAIVEAPCSDRTLVSGRVRLFDTASGAESRPDLGSDVTHLHALDPDRMLVAGLQRMATRIVEYTCSSGAVRHLLTTESNVGPREPACWPTPDDGLVFVAETWSEPAHLVKVRHDGTTERLWSGAHAGTAAMSERVRDLRTVRWTAPDGWEIEGLVAVPQGDGPHPTVMYPHGGPVTSWRARFLGGYAIVPALLELGYAIFMPNPRGSTGYGWEFADAVHGDMGGKDTHDLLSGLDALVDMGLADPDRLVVMGGSYAGYMAAWIVTQTDRFKASLASAPVTNWISQHFQSNIPEWGRRFLPETDHYPGGGYVDRSPVFFADRVSTPVWIEGGALDRCCPPTQCIEYHEALRRHGVPTDLVIYPDEAHNIPLGEQLLAYLERQLDWIARWCPPNRPPAAPAEIRQEHTG